MKILKKKHLEIAIQDIPKHKNPKIKLEQYFTPANIAAELMWNAYNFGDIINKSILDLGCGTGILTITPLILGAKIAFGIDIDPEAIFIAEETAKSMEIKNSHFFIDDVNNTQKIKEDIFLNNNFNENIDLKIDTLFTNPPFGSQSRSKKGSDRIFMELAMELANVSYSFHMYETREFVINYYEKLGGKVTDEFFFNFPLPNSYSFHTKESKDIEIIVLRVENTK